MAISILVKVTTRVDLEEAIRRRLLFQESLLEAAAIFQLQYILGDKMGGDVLVYGNNLFNKRVGFWIFAALPSYLKHSPRGKLVYRCRHSQKRCFDDDPILIFEVVHLNE